MFGFQSTSRRPIIWSRQKEPMTFANLRYSRGKGTEVAAALRLSWKHDTTANCRLHLCNDCYESPQGKRELANMVLLIPYQQHGARVELAVTTNERLRIAQLLCCILGDNGHLIYWRSDQDASTDSQYNSYHEGFRGTKTRLGFSTVPVYWIENGVLHKSALQLFNNDHSR